MAERAAVIYDDRCKLCTATTRWLGWCDRFGLFRPLPQSSPELAQVAPLLTADDLHGSMWVVPPGLAPLRSALAVRYMAWRLPLLLPIAWLLAIPGMLVPAEWLYRRLAANRYRLSEWLYGCGDACAVPPRPGAAA